jgi:hypothetical protein
VSHVDGAGTAVRRLPQLADHCRGVGVVCRFEIRSSTGKNAADDCVPGG